MVNRGWVPRHFPESEIAWDKPTEPVSLTVVATKGEGKQGG